MISMWNGYVKR